VKHNIYILLHACSATVRFLHSWAGCTSWGCYPQLSHIPHSPRSCFALPVGCVLLHSLHHLKGHALTRLFTSSCMAFAWAVLFSIFVFSNLLLLLHICGTGFWVILVLFIFVCCSVFCEFLDFLHFWNVSGRMLRIPGFSPFSRISRAGWFLFCPVCRFVTVPTVLGGLAVRRHNNKKQQKKNWRTRYAQTWQDHAESMRCNLNRGGDGRRGTRTEFKQAEDH